MSRSLNSGMPLWATEPLSCSCSFLAMSILFFQHHPSKQALVGLEPLIAKAPTENTTLWATRTSWNHFLDLSCLLSGHLSSETYKLKDVNVMPWTHNLKIVEQWSYHLEPSRHTLKMCSLELFSLSSACEALKGGLLPTTSKTQIHSTSLWAKDKFFHLRFWECSSLFEQTSFCGTFLRWIVGKILKILFHCEKE